MVSGIRSHGLRCWQLRTKEILHPYRMDVVEVAWIWDNHCLDYLLPWGKEFLFLAERENYVECFQPCWVPADPGTDRTGTDSTLFSLCSEIGFERLSGMLKWGGKVKRQSWNSLTASSKRTERGNWDLEGRRVGGILGWARECSRDCSNWFWQAKFGCCPQIKTLSLLKLSSYCNLFMQPKGEMLYLLSMTHLPSHTFKWKRVSTDVVIGFGHGFSYCWFLFWTLVGTQTL